MSRQLLQAADSIEYSYQISPHYNNRPMAIDGVLIHSCGEYIGGTYAPDFMESAGYSYHGLITPSGKVIVCVHRKDRAWHAGRSFWAGQHDLNNSFIGFCLMLQGDWTYGRFRKAIDQPGAYSPEQLHSLDILSAFAVKDYDINPDRILRHSDVSSSDVRPDPKYDPGQAFDLQAHRMNVQAFTHVQR